MSEASSPRLPGRVVQLLTRYPGIPFCVPCLAHMLEVPVAEASGAVAKARAVIALTSEARWCLRCGRFAEVAYAGLMVAPPFSPWEQSAG